MNNPDKKTADLIDRLTESNVNFALYRLPWTDACHLVLQKSNDIEKLDSLYELNERKGFVFAPFIPNSKHKVLIIRPDIMAYDWEEIEHEINAFCKENGIEHSEKENIEKQVDDINRDYEKRFYVFKDAMKSGRFSKIVLSRYITEPIENNFSPLNAFINACNSYPRMFIYLCHTTASGTWVGSTPEIVLSGNPDSWHTVALAGTMSIQNEVVPTEWDIKNCDEQKIVADYIRQTLKKLELKSKIEEKGPYTARAGQLVHRKTDFFFTLKENSKIGLVLENLHPTPAVCGLPKDDAILFIHDNEGYDRRYYSGIVGWIDIDNGTDLYVNLRCMEIGKNNARLYAGGGLLPSSDMETEWEETNRKLATMNKILKQGNNQ